MAPRRCGVPAQLALLLASTASCLFAIRAEHSGGADAVPAGRHLLRASTVRKSIARALPFAAFVTPRLQTVQRAPIVGTFSVRLVSRPLVPGLRVVPPFKSAERLSVRMMDEGAKISGDGYDEAGKETNSLLDDDELPWKPAAGGGDQTYAILEGREIRGPVSVRFAASDAEVGPRRGPHRWLAKPETMWGVKRSAKGRNVQEREDLSVPKPQGGEVLVRVYTAALDVCDVVNEAKKAAVPGCEFAGTIVEVGANCQRLRVGDEVWGFFPRDRGGALAEFVAVEEALMALKPLDLEWAFAAAMPRAGIAALFAVAPWPSDPQAPPPRWVAPSDQLLVLGADSPVTSHDAGAAAPVPLSSPVLPCRILGSVRIAWISHQTCVPRRNQDLLASLGANTRDESRVKGAKGWQGDGLMQPGNGNSDRNEDRIDLRAINPSGVFDQVFDCRPERPPSIAESSMWVGEDEPPRKNQEKGEPKRFRLWRLLNGSSRKPLPGVALVDANLADMLVKNQCGNEVQEDVVVSKLDRLVADRGRQRVVPLVSNLLDQLRQSVEDGSLIPVLDPLSPFACQDSASALALLENRANRAPPVAWAIKHFEIIESSTADETSDDGEYVDASTTEVVRKDDGEPRRGLFSGWRNQKWNIAGRSEETQAMARIAADAAAFRPAGGLRGGYPQEVVLLRRGPRGKSKRFASVRGKGSKSKNRDEMLYTNGDFEVRYDALEPAPVLGQVWSNIDDSYFWLHQFFRRIDSTDRSQVDLQLRLTPTVARAIERERQACVEAGAPDGTCFLWAVGNAGTGKLVVQVFPRTKVVRLSDVENVKKRASSKDGVASVPEN